MAHLYSKPRLIRTEVTTLIGLMMRAPIGRTFFLRVREQNIDVPRRIIHHLRENHRPRRRQRSACPPKVQRAGVSVPNRFLPCRGLVDRVKRQGDPDNEAAEKWFIARRWPDGIYCVACGSFNVQIGAKRKRASFRCREKECGKQFSTKTGTFMQSSKISYQDWLFALYLVATNLKSISSMKLHREIGITQKAAWHLAHRVRKAWEMEKDELFEGPVEVDKSYFGGKERNKHESKKLKAGRGNGQQDSGSGSQGSGHQSDQRRRGAGNLKARPARIHQ